MRSLHRLARPVILCLAVFLSLAAPTGSALADLAADLAEIARKSGIATQRIAYSVHDVRLGQDLAGLNARTPMTPASNMKVVTTGAALLVLGPDFRFETTLWLERINGFVRLTLVGSGDPALDDPALRARDPHGFETLAALWAEALRADGVTRVDELVVDARIFDRERFHPSWPREQYPNAYCAEVWGLNLARNVVGITPSPSGGGKPGVTFTPAFDLPISRNGATSNAGEKFGFTASRPFDSNALVLRGNVDKRPSAPLGLTVHDTPSLTADLLRRRLAQHGVSVAKSRIAAADDPRASGTIVPPVHATPIATVLERANTDSDNLYAEALLKRMGAAVANTPPDRPGAVGGDALSQTRPCPEFTPGSWMNGRTALRTAIAALIGTDVLSDWTLDDGSGLSQENRLTASGLTEWHSAFARDPQLAPLYFGSLAIAGKTGTVRRRFPDLADGPVEVRCKTGYIRGVSTLSGLAIAPDGRAIAFSILGNNLAQGDQIARARAMQEAMVRRIVRELAPPPRG